jgi:FMN phosphatase YigB (HAD superfamily)
VTESSSIQAASPSFSVAQFKALIFDLDGTLYRQEPVRRAMAWRILRAHVWHPIQGLSTVRVLQAYRRAQETLRSAGVSGDPVAQQIRLAAKNCELGESEVQSRVARWSGRALDLLSPALRPGIVELLQFAREKGMLLGVLSDYPAEAKLSAMGLRNYFDVVVSASDPDVQCFKPSPRGLEIVLRRLGLEKHEALYIGDRPEVDGAAAAAVGVRCAILASSHNQQAPWWEISGFDELRNALRGH